MNIDSLQNLDKNFFLVFSLKLKECLEQGNISEDDFEQFLLDYSKALYERDIILLSKQFSFLQS